MQHLTILEMSTASSVVIFLLGGLLGAATSVCLGVLIRRIYRKKKEAIPRPTA